MFHFLDISQFSLQKIEQLLQRALEFKTDQSYPSYAHYTVAHLFYENSTRTRVSFEVAAKKLSMEVINIQVQHSSERKGESIEDTLLNLSAIGINICVIRHAQNGLPQLMAEKVGDKIQLINAGDGINAHPTQALLDFMTIYENKPDFSQLKIAIVGDIRHSRVANSLQKLFSLIGIKKLILVAPEIWQPPQVLFGESTTSLQEGITDADVIIGLRVQHERLQDNEHINLEMYRSLYCLTEEMLFYAKPDVMIMHPGPLNRGIEMTDEVANGSHSFILKQVKNGVFMRMAILESLTNNH